MNDSLIEKKLSTGWKGILILLIVLGHCSLLCKYGPGESDFYTWRSWLYSFHVWGFFVLPFFYGSKTINMSGWGVYWKTLRKYLVKLYIPYTWITMVCILIALVLGKNLNLVQVIQAWIVGSQWMTSQYIGFHFLWFLPTMFAVLVMRDVYFNLGLRGRGIMVLLFLCFCIAELVGISLGCLNYLPFNLVSATKYALVGILSRHIVEYVGAKSLKHRLAKYGVYLLFLIATILFFMLDTTPKETSCLKFLSFFLSLSLPVTFGCFIIWYQKLGDSRFLQLFGRYSLEIYLFHVIVYNVLLICVQRFVSPNLFIGIVLYALTLGISIGIAILIERNKLIHSILFPTGKGAIGCVMGKG